MRIVYDLLQLDDVRVMALLHDRDLSPNLVLGRAHGLIRQGARHTRTSVRPSGSVHAEALMFGYALDDLDSLQHQPRRRSILETLKYGF